MPMKTPVHPGRIVRHDCLEPLGLSVSSAAKILGVSRQALNNIVNERAGISPEMAIRLTKAFGSTEETWLRMQMAYDLAAARKNASHITVRRQRAPETACFVICYFWGAVISACFESSVSTFVFRCLIV